MITTLVSLIAQTKTGAYIEIIILLLVAGLIAFLTAYFYYKPIYLRQINKLKDEKTDLERKVTNLQVQVSDLNTKNEELENNLEEMKKAGEKKKGNK